ncbi:kynureninase [Psychroflexus sediminis]|uniref:Kynureninase n=1 Tax=Psychroflexus sediminis TaxID=470826 RepID=A0A1G7Y780_9FLAO|nr:kynureninase [Psychroflexus sediminis]SDG92269.1 Kynureninase [Psychroflexus sediminis]
MKYDNSRAFAEEQDQNDPLHHFRNQFHFPVKADGSPKIYLCGNSLGLQPKQTADYVQQELDDWARFGVEGHTDARTPWLTSHEDLAIPMAKIVGAKPEEVVIMNTLTVNLHLMMVSFYKPTGKKFKILIESDAFPSDKYAVESQLKFHNIDPKEGLILWNPRPGEHLCRHEDFEELLETHKDEIALVMVGSTNYYSGQAFDLQRIAKGCQDENITVGFDLAHGAGNIQPNLHDIGADFAVWCTYKYLNSGPGSLGGCFVHEKHIQNQSLNKFVGWWGHNKASRFNMRKDFDPTPTAEGWQLSNPPILSLAGTRSSLDLFEKAGFDKLREKSVKLTGFLEFLIDELDHEGISILTPRSPEERGCQLSIQMKNAERSLFDQLTAKGLVADWREPDVIRIAPAPLYNSFTDVYEFVHLLKHCLHDH